MRAGRPWGEPVPAGARFVDVAGGDAALAAAADDGADVVVRFAPAADSDLARALGLGGGGGPGTTVVAVDLLEVGDRGPAANAVVLGVAPRRLRRWDRRRRVTVRVDGAVVADGRATTVVVANGQFLHGDDLVPRGHPGDGRLEVQVYALPPGGRRALRRRLAGGNHVPHPAILETSGRRVRVDWHGRERPVEVDGRADTPAHHLEVAVRPAAVTVLI